MNEHNPTLSYDVEKTVGTVIIKPQNEIRSPHWWLEGEKNKPVYDTETEEYRDDMLSFGYFADELTKELHTYGVTYGDDIMQTEQGRLLHEHMRIEGVNRLSPLKTQHIPRAETTYPL